MGISLENSILTILQFISGEILGVLALSIACLILTGVIKVESLNKSYKSFGEFEKI